MPKTRFFYTRDYPFRWTSGAHMMRLNDDFREIESLDEARELAEKYRVGGYEEDSCVTTYGVEYIGEED